MVRLTEVSLAITHRCQDILRVPLLPLVTVLLSLNILGIIQGILPGFAILYYAYKLLIET